MPHEEESKHGQIFDVRILQEENVIVLKFDAATQAAKVSEYTLEEFADANTPEKMLHFVKKYGLVFEPVEEFPRLTCFAFEHLDSLEEARLVLSECMRIRAYIDGREDAIDDAGAAWTNEVDDISFYRLPITSAQYISFFKDITLEHNVHFDDELQLISWGYNDDKVPYAMVQLLPDSDDLKMSDIEPSPEEELSEMLELFEKADAVMDSLGIDDYRDIPKAELDKMVRNSFPKPSKQAIEKLLNITIMAHVQSSGYLGFDFTGQDSNYRPRFDSLLARMWHEFGEMFSEERVRTCRHCERLIVAPKKRYHEREYCNKKCRDNAYNERNRKARELTLELFFTKRYTPERIVKEIADRLETDKELPSVKRWIQEELKRKKGSRA